MERTDTQARETHRSSARPRNQPDLRNGIRVAPSRAAPASSHGHQVGQWGLRWFVVVFVTACGGGDFPTNEPEAELTVATDAAVVPPPFAPSAVGAALNAMPASSPTADAEPPLVIRRQPQSLEVRAGGVAQFAVDVDGPHPITYQWLYDDEVLGDETGSAVRLSVRPADHLATISVVIKAGHRTIKSNAAVLRVGRD